MQQSPARATLLFIPYATYDMWRPCRGKNRESVTYAEFYAAIGRPDLLEAHKSRETTGTILGVTQIGLTLGAVGFAAVALFKEDADYWWPAGGCLLGAMTAGVIRGSRSPLPIDSDEALRLADAYNDGAAPAPTSRSRQVPLDPQLSALGFVLPVVSGRF